jgi:hypothetical protein
LKSIQYLFNILKENNNCSNWDSDYEAKVKSKIKNFTINLSKKWKKNNRTLNKFFINNEKWLKTEFKLPERSFLNYPSSRGRPTKSFTECSDRTKRRKTKKILTNFTSPEIRFALRSNYYRSGKRSAAKLVKEMSLTPTRSKKIRIAYVEEMKNKKPRPYTPDETLAFIIDNNLTKA